MLPSNKSRFPYTPRFQVSGVARITPVPITAPKTMHVVNGAVIIKTTSVAKIAILSRQQVRFLKHAL